MKKTKGCQQYLGFEKLRIKKVLPYIRGRLLDIGCGYNNLVRKYGKGVGVDIVNYGNADVIIEDASKLPFRNESFDTVTMLAVLNHITRREAALLEAHRVLKKGGKLLITMINPTVGRIVHTFFKEDENKRGFAPGEKMGLSKKTVKNLLKQAGIALKKISYFELGLNTLYIARKEANH